MVNLQKLRILRQLRMYLIHFRWHGRLVSSPLHDIKIVTSNQLINQLILQLVNLQLIHAIEENLFSRLARTEAISKVTMKTYSSFQLREYSHVYYVQFTHREWCAQCSYSEQF